MLLYPFKPARLINELLQTQQVSNFSGIICCKGPLLIYYSEADTQTPMDLA